MEITAINKLMVSSKESCRDTPDINNRTPIVRDLTRYCISLIGFIRYSCVEYCL